MKVVEVFRANIGKTLATIAIGVATVGVTWLCAFLWAHFAWSSEAKKQIPINEDAIARVSELALELGERHKEEDAAKAGALAERRRLCLARQLNDPVGCAEVGVELPAESPPP